MFLIKLLLIPVLSFSFESTVLVKKVEGYKIFKATVEAQFDAEVSEVVKGIENFDDKCNNEKRSKRKYSNWEKVCSFHNENLVEAVKLNSFNNAVLTKNYPDAKYLMWRNIYNKGRYSHYDVISKKSENGEIIIKHEKIPEDFMDKILKKHEKTVSAFEQIHGTYRVSAMSNGKVKVVYVYESKTNHWFLMRDFLENKILENMNKGTIQAVRTIEESLTKKKRAI